MEEKIETTAANADSKLNDSELKQEKANSSAMDTNNESELSKDEGEYNFEENSMQHDEDAENQEFDFSKWDSYNFDQIKEEALKVLSQNEDVAIVGAAFKKLRELHNAIYEKERQTIIAEGDETEDNKEKTEILEKNNSEFNSIWNIYQEKRKKHFENLQKQQEENYNKKIILLYELKKLIDEGEPLKNTFDEFRNIQEKWREIGMVPKEKNNDLWLNYNHHVQMFLDKVKLNRELRDLDLKKNLEIKVELCEKAETLILEKSLHESFKKLQELHRQWKETGAVPSDVKDEVWERFRNASEKIREIRIKHYEDLNKKLDANLDAKQALTDKAKNIASGEFNNIKDWNNATKEMTELFDLWRTIGPAPKEHNDKIWSDFKGVLDEFYLARKDFFNVIRTEANDNYNKKLNICLEAEAIKDSTEWKKSSNELIRLQNEWKKIGPVPKIKSDTIWKRFRTACDTFFNNKKEYFENINKIEIENLKKKEALIKELENYQFSEDNKENLNKIHDFQRRWVEIGRIPIDKKETIQHEWQKKIDQILDNLKISRFESENTRYKERLNLISKMEDGNDKMWIELKKLRFNISKIEQDVQLWENNLSFFASSKNADVLLKEFKEKIDKAKTDIKVMKEKEKYLQNLINSKK